MPILATPGAARRLFTPSKEAETGKLLPGTASHTLAVPPPESMGLHWKVKI